MPTLAPQHQYHPISNEIRLVSSSVPLARPSVLPNPIPSVTSDRPTRRGSENQYKLATRFLTGIASVSKQFHRKQIIIQKGEAGSSVYVILSGRVKVASLSPDGKEIIFAYLGAGEFFGEVAVLDGTSHMTTVTAVEPTILRIIDRRDFRTAMERDPKAVLALATTLCERLRRASELAEDMSFLDVADRLAKTLLHLVETHGTPAKNGIRIGFPLCQQELANLVATTRESINKQLRIWQDDGWLSIETSTLIIHRLSELKKLVQACAGDLL